MAFGGRRVAVGLMLLALASSLADVGRWAQPAPQMALAQPAGLQYQNRGNRYEGIRPRPVSGYDVELLSARVEHAEPGAQMPDRLRLRFHLDRPATVHLTVRELDYVHYYWLDRVQPTRPWTVGFGNTFEWSTRDVLRQLAGLSINDLGVVARLDRPEPSAIERVAPVILSHAEEPREVARYVFTFRTGGDARVEAAVFREVGGAALFTDRIARQLGGRPFAVRWDASRQAPGAYTLTIGGYFLDTNARVSQAVHFYHQPRLR